MITNLHPILSRFPHIPFVEETRVVLRPDASSRNSYINANYVTGYTGNRADSRTPPDLESTDCYRTDIVYIAAASPFDTITALDFWRCAIEGLLLLLLRRTTKCVHLAYAVDY